MDERVRAVRRLLKYPRQIIMINLVVEVGINGQIDNFDGRIHWIFGGLDTIWEEKSPLGWTTLGYKIGWGTIIKNTVLGVQLTSRGDAGDITGYRSLWLGRDQSWR